MEHLVIDTNVLIAYLVELDAFHQRSQPYIQGLENGEYTFHLPMLVPVEVASVISRRDGLPKRLAILSGWRQTLLDWEQDGKIVLYPLDRSRMDYAVNIAHQYHLKRGADTVIAALAEELDMPLKTFDMDILARFPRASV